MFCTVVFPVFNFFSQLGAIGQCKGRLFEACGTDGGVMDRESKTLLGVGDVKLYDGVAEGRTSLPTC
jgi:hypothetical protein